MTTRDPTTHDLVAENMTAAAEFHERVKAACWDHLIGQLVMLHQPHQGADVIPRCHGCDRDRGEVGAGDPVWPCRTYSTIASTVLAEMSQKPHHV